MIWPVMRVSWLNLKRDRVAQALTFVLPIAFFSIFAWVFGQLERSATKQVEVAVVDEDGSPTSRRLVAALKTDPSLDVRMTTPRDNGVPITRQLARDGVGAGNYPVAIVFPRGFGDQFGDFFTSPATVEMIVDNSDPIAPQLINGLLQKTAMTAAPDLMVERGVDMFRKYAGGLTDAQEAAMTVFLPQLRTLAAESPDSQPAGSQATSGGSAFAGPIRVQQIDAVAGDHQLSKSPAIAFYAAGTAVMFLLFMAAGAGGSLIEEEENGTIERLIASQLGMTQLLVGKWVFLSLVGFVQVFVMFTWGRLVFGLDLFSPRNFAGFCIMTTVTTAGAASFGLMLATLCRSRAQLSGLSTILILIMSAIGGSMFPPHMMPPIMKQLGLATFNAWALDGYHKVFWYTQPLTKLWPQVVVLTALTLAFFGLARLMARRWETV